VTEGAREQGRVSSRAAARLAWSLWGLVILFAVASFILRHWVAPPSLHTGTWGLEDILWWSVLIPALVPAYATVGALVVARRPSNPVGWLCLVLGALVALEDVVWQIPQQYATPALETTLGLLWALVFPPLPLMLLLLVFPDGRLPSRRWQFVVWLALGAAGLSALAVAVADLQHAELGKVAENVAWPASLLALLASVISLFFRWRGSEGVERQQLKWLAYTGVSIVVALLGGVASGYVSGEHSYPTVLFLSVTIAGLTIGVPVAIGVAMLRHRLYDVDLLINRTLVYGMLTGILALFYLGGVVALQALLRSLTGRGSQLAIVASTLAIAALFSPLRRRIQSFIDRRFYRRKYDARKTLEAFSAKLRDETGLDALSSDLAAVVRETMQPAHVSLWLRPDTPPKGKQPD
jgi:hypothetical protein